VTGRARLAGVWNQHGWNTVNLLSPELLRAKLPRVYLTSLELAMRTSDHRGSSPVPDKSTRYAENKMLL